MHYAVIGAGYGDEGKGLMTDYLCRKLSDGDGHPLNIRFNGGAQAGHTVVTKDQRHVFSHVGAGSFAGSTTYLSGDFVVNPLLMLQEKHANRVFVHPKAKVTTVFDVTLNRFREMARGAEKHGSCGVGVNETVTRHLSGFQFHAEDLFEKDEWIKDFMLSHIYEGWFLPSVKRIKNNITKDTFEHYMEIASVENEMKLFNEVWPCFELSDAIHFAYEHVVFEGAQGLELDEELGQFPHVTRSICGIKAALKAADELGIAGLIQPVYITRCYKTRHGAGPLAHEGEDFIGRKLEDKTNMTGLWQGEFRYAPLDLNSLYKIIANDMARVDDKRLTKPVIALTHLDEMDPDIRIVDYDGELKWVTEYDLIKKLGQIAPVTWASYGERADHVQALWMG